MTDPAGRDEPWHTLSVKRIVRAGAWTVAFLVVILTGDAAIRFITGAPAVFDVNAWAIVKCLVQVFAAACIADVLSRRWEGTWFADACIAAPVATFVLWAGLNVVEMDIGTWPLCRAVRRDVPHASGCALDEATEVTRQRFRLTRSFASLAHARHRMRRDPVSRPSAVACRPPGPLLRHKVREPACNGFAERPEDPGRRCGGGRGDACFRRASGRERDVGVVTGFVDELARTWRAPPISCPR